MKIRKKAAAVSAVLLLALALQACSSPGTPAPTAKAGASTNAVNGKGKTLDILVQLSTDYPTQQVAWFKHMQNDFKKLTGANIVFETYSSTNDELKRMQTAIVSGQGPDIFELSSTFVPTAYASGAFVRLDDQTWDKVGGRDKFVPATLGLSGPDKKDEIGVPFSSDPIILAYNKSMFKAAGFDKPATTWDGLLKQAKALTKDGVYGMAVPYADNKAPWKFIWEMSNEMGNGFVDGKKATVDKPTTLAAYKEFYSWLTDGVVNPAAVGWTQAQSLAAFADGKAAILPQTNPRSKATLDQSSVAADYGYALMPTVAPGYKKNPSGGVASPTHVGGQLDAVANYSSNQDLAWAYINMVTSPKEQLYTYSTILYQPADAKASASLAKSGKNAGVTIGIAAAKAAAPTAFTGAWADIQLAISNVVVQSIPALAKGGISDSKLKQLLAQAQSDSQAALDRAPGK